MRGRLLWVLVLAAACGGGAAAKNPDLSKYDPSKLASAEQCEQAVDNYEKAQFLATDQPVREKRLFNRTEFSLEHRRRVDRCTTSFSERQAACIAGAPSLQYVKNCELYAELQ
jgi:hypothetical protein